MLYCRTVNRTLTLLVILLAGSLASCMPDQGKQAAALEAMLAAEGITALKLGDTAPQFSLAASDGTQLSPLEGATGYCVLYFFPVADTPNSATGLIKLTQLSEKLAASGISCLGIGPQSPQELAAFAAKYKITIPLLSDPELSVARLYGCAAEGFSMPQRTLCGVRPDGTLAFYTRTHYWVSSAQNYILNGFGIKPQAK